MAVTGAIFNSLIFGGVDSANYGIYITGEAVYNAPERAVEMVTVPGRNGAIAIDQGRWENIEVEYPAGCFGDGDANFADRISAFRNAVLSQLGYQRLTDTYHPDEFRMAIYVAGLEVEPANINSAGEFKLIFNCKPQRFLTSGETAVTVTSGGTITNPTLCESHPKLEAKGYGSITLGGGTITIANRNLGETLLTDKLVHVQSASSVAKEAELESECYQTGDLIYTKSTVLADGSVEFLVNTAQYESDADAINLSIPASRTWTAGTGATWQSTQTGTFTITSLSDNSTYSVSYDVRLAAVYFGSQYEAAEVFVYYELTGTGASLVDSVACTSTLYPIYVNSTLPGPGFPAYIDFDTGEAYKINGGAVISLNNLVSIPAELPKLSAGNNNITFDNTITELKIVPRWWKL